MLLRSKFIFAIFSWEVRSQHETEIWYHWQLIFFEGKSSQALLLMKSRIAKVSESQDLLFDLFHIWRAIVLFHHVHFKIAGLVARIAAPATFVWFFPWVSTFVCYQRSSLSGRVVALITLERFLACMDPHVFLQDTSSCAGEWTLCATERLLSRMLPHVSPECTSFYTGKGTLCTAERFLS